MNMPRFTAETSLYSTGVDYRNRVHSSLLESTLFRTIFPQMQEYSSLRIPNCGPNGVLICYQGHCSCW
jgi:hypothetical protein